VCFPIGESASSTPVWRHPRSIETQRRRTSASINTWSNGLTNDSQMGHPPANRRRIQPHSLHPHNCMSTRPILWPTHIVPRFHQPGPHTPMHDRPALCNPLSLLSPPKRTHIALRVLRIRGQTYDPTRLHGIQWPQRVTNIVGQQDIFWTLYMYLLL
jgi:hypothetical protein